MKCHYHKDKQTGERFLIPGCWGVALHWHLPDKEAMEWCYCPKNEKTQSELIQDLRTDLKKLRSDFEKYKSERK